MEIINYPKYDEKVIYEELDNGLKVYLMPKKDYHKVYASFTTKYGSLNIYEDEENRTKTGIAHYLEHMLFNNDKKDIEEIFARMGAVLNAYTSINHTCFYFNTSSDYLFLLEELIDFVLHPSLNEESLEKERLIILEELKMYLDDKVTVMVNETMEDLYEKHPIRYDIGGLISEVKEISLAELKEEHAKFYHPSNMILFVVGNLDVDSTLNLIHEYFKKNVYEKKTITKFYPKVKKEVVRKEKIIEEGRNVPKVMLGFKITSDIDSLRLRTLLTMYMSLAISETSDLYEELVNSGICNTSFSYTTTVLEDTCCTLVYSDTKDPDVFKEKIVNTLQNFKVSEEDFNKFRNKYLGATFNALNNLDSIMYEGVSALVEGHSLFDTVDLVNDIKYEEIKDLGKLFNEYSYTLLK